MPDALMPVPASVLVFGRDSQLVHTRGLILEKAGFRVRTAASLPDIQQMPSEPNMDIMLLCHSLSTQDCDEALIITHERWPQIQTIALVSGSLDCGSESADAAIETSEGPAKLINAVRKRIN
jgi:DNA-binding NtrC family response regulator